MILGADVDAMFVKILGRIRALPGSSTRIPKKISDE